MMRVPARGRLLVLPEIRDSKPAARSGYLDALRSSVLAVGVRVPLVACCGVLLDGHKRYDIAMRWAGVRLPVEVVPPGMLADYCPELSEEARQGVLRHLEGDELAPQPVAHEPEDTACCTLESEHA